MIKKDNFENFNKELAHLYEREGLIELDKKFLSFLEDYDSVLFSEALKARLNTLTSEEESHLIINLAPCVERFLSTIFNIRKDIEDHIKKHEALDPLYECKKLFIQKRAAKNKLEHKLENKEDFIHSSLLRKTLEDLFQEPFSELTFACHVLKWLEEEDTYKKELNIALEYASWAISTEEGQAFHHKGVLFKIPRKLDYSNLVPTETEIKKGILFKKYPKFASCESLTSLEEIGTLEKTLDQVSYCLKCHHQKNDFCSKGLETEEYTKKFKHRIFQERLSGCPLDEKISEMNVVKSQGFSLAALAIIIIDNPMVAATGVGICNDCAKSCIYQKQDPVQVPFIETSILEDVLSFPWGFEIYSLLTRWNPMNFRRPFPKAPSGYKVLIVGLGPSGFTLAHHLLNDGHAVAAIDGLKIEPLEEGFSGRDVKGQETPFYAIYDVKNILNGIDTRVREGFGGVMEYGITSRWNKNYLKLIRMLLERRKEYIFFGGVRFGGTLTIAQALEMGFDHIALCMGAGQPNIIPLKNGLTRGVRQASDFLMALQLTGAEDAQSISNLQIRLPAVVIGGGLTAMDAATEILAYYPKQVEKFLSRYEELIKILGEKEVRSTWTEEDKEIFREFQSHAMQLREERKNAEKEEKPPKIKELLQIWGGVTIAYRKELKCSPSYQTHEEEVRAALRKGVMFAENLTPLTVEKDIYGASSGLKLQDEKGEVHTLSARTILVAAGTSPNTILAQEDCKNLSLDGKYFKAANIYGESVQPEAFCKPKETYVLMKDASNSLKVSFFGDLHPSFSGNVVKAMASAKKGFPIITEGLVRFPPKIPLYKDLWQNLNNMLRPTIHCVQRLTPNILEIVLKAPAMAKAFKPGHFFRLQNFESLSFTSHNTKFLMEGVALTGVESNPEKGLISTIVQERGASTFLCKMFKPGEPVVFMGPTGSSTYIPSQETVLLIGEGIGNATLLSLGKALKEKGCRVIYLAGYRKIIERYKKEYIEDFADQVVWCSEQRPGFFGGRKQDINFVGTVTQAMEAYGMRQLVPILYPFEEVSHVMVVGSSSMMKETGRLCQKDLAHVFHPACKIISSINSPMQCMMKGVCGQCIQTHIDPLTQAEKIVFSCVAQDQDIQSVDFNELRARLKQNSLQEKLSKLWVEYCFSNCQKKNSSIKKI